MATKKVEAVKPVQAVAPVKAAPVKETVKVAPVKTETVKETVKAEPVKAEAKAPKKEAVKKTAPKKEAAKKTVAKKTSEEKACNFYIQYAGKQFSYEEIIAKAKEAAAAEMGKTTASVKSIDIYCKPEEHAAYYVVGSKKVAGRIDL
ncbi:MAG: DUF6465 family protein [Lachnospiraceae bacterium]